MSAKMNAYLRETTSNNLPDETDPNIAPINTEADNTEA